MSDSGEYLVIVPELTALEKALKIAGWGLVPVVMGGIEAWKWINQLGIPAVTVAGPDLTDELVFPLGRVDYGILFRRHPFIETRYIQTAEYNPYLLREKTQSWSGCF